MTLLAIASMMRSVMQWVGFGVAQLVIVIPQPEKDHYCLTVQVYIRIMYVARCC